MTISSPKPFHFLADVRGPQSAHGLAEAARRAEATGYHALCIPDHLIDQLSPVPAMAVIAAATTTLRFSAFVLNNDLRHPAVLAADLASLDVLSEGRLDVAIGAGWNVPEYEQSGIPFDPVPVRQARLAESVTVLKGLFADGRLTFEGTYYTITRMDGGPKPVQRPHPPFMIGGGGRTTLELAAREADIVSLAPRIKAGRSELASISAEGTHEKIDWVRAAAGERFDQLELNIYPTTIGPIVTDDPRRALEEAADEVSGRRGERIDPEFLAASPHVFINSVEGYAERFAQIREEYGISSFMVGELGELDAVVERLTGS